MNRQAQGGVMLLLGGAILRATWTDTYLRYVKQALQPFLIAAGLLLVAAAVMTLRYELRSQPADPSEQDDDGHHHGHSGPRVGWLLLLPSLGLLVMTPPALGADTVARAGSMLNRTEEVAYPPLPPGDPAKLTLVDYGYRAVYDEGRTLRDRQIELTGFIAPGPDGQPMLARIILACCAADGVPIKIGLRGDVPRLPSDSWVQVLGHWIPHTATDSVNDSKIPYLEVERWQRTRPPSEQYE